MMKKCFLLSPFFLVFLGGCSLEGITSPKIDMDTVVNSGADMLSGVWNTTKEVSKDFYEEQIKPTVDTAIDATQQEMERLKQEAKNQVNSGIDQAGQKFSNRMQEKADTIKDKIGDLKIE